MERPKTQTIEITVPGAGATVSLNNNTSNDHDFVRGLFIECVENITGSEFDRLEINNVEIFGEGFSPNAIKENDYKSYKDVVYNLVGIKANYSQIRGNFIDGGNAGAYPYTLKLHLLTTKEE